MVSTRRFLPKDHPRACGEKKGFVQSANSSMGSPPRMRGKGKGSQDCQRVAGITPAHAGKRVGSETPKRWYKDHPRACGEKPAEVPPLAASLGSPPRMRGKVHSVAKAHQGSGITPAHAGKSFTRALYMPDFWDHPRACGEKNCPTKADASSWGSPPRMRGKGNHIGGY